MRESELESTTRREIKDRDSMENLSEGQLIEQIRGKEKRTIVEQLNDANTNIQVIEDEIRSEYLSPDKGLKKILRGFLYDTGIVSLEKDEAKKRELFVKLKAQSSQNLEHAIEKYKADYEDLKDYEIRLNAFEILIERKTKALEDEQKEQESIRQELEQLADLGRRTALEDAYRESSMNTFILNNEINEYKSQYRILYDESVSVRSIVDSELVDIHHLRQTDHALGNQIRQIDSMLRKGFGAKDVLEFMKKTYSAIESTSGLTNMLLRKTFGVSEALSEVKNVTDKISEKNNFLYRQKSNLSAKIKDDTSIMYEQIREERRRMDYS